MHTVIFALLTFIVCYLIGSIPTAYLLVKAVKGIDVRTVGSGNVGATNAGRALGRWAFFTVLFLDALKGFFPVYAAYRLGMVHNMPLLAIASGSGVIVGHAYTVFLRFKGGKGVATGLGVFLALSPVAVFIALLVFVLTVLIWRMISLGSILAAVTMAVSVVFLYQWKALWIFTGLIALFVIIKHIGNIKRIFAGNENKVNLKL